MCMRNPVRRYGGCSFGPWRPLEYRGGSHHIEDRPCSQRNYLEVPKRPLPAAKRPDSLLTSPHRSSRNIWLNQTNHYIFQDPYVPVGHPDHHGGSDHRFCLFLHRRLLSRASQGRANGPQACHPLGEDPAVDIQRGDGGGGQGEHPPRPIPDFHGQPPERVRHPDRTGAHRHLFRLDRQERAVQHPRFRRCDEKRRVPAHRPQELREGHAEHRRRRRESSGRESRS